MSLKKLPPLLVGERYRAPLPAGLDIMEPDLRRELQGEATAMLRIAFPNGTALEVPARAYQMQMLMGSLMRAFPQQALLQLRFAGEDRVEDPEPAESNQR